MLNKVALFDSVVAKVKLWHAEGQRIVLCHGCFDPLHIGHLRHFKASRGYGERLVVTVTDDEFVNKGPDRPLFPADYRLEMVSALRVVDAAAINLWDSALETIQRLKPNYFAKGADYRQRTNCNSNFLLEEQVMQEIGGQVVFTDESSFSSTKLITWINRL